jgi:hypothetical protein
MTAPARKVLHWVALDAVSPVVSSDANLAPILHHPS